MSFTCPDCNTTIPGSNCAHTLSRLSGWRDKPNCTYMCPCKYPVRAKEVRLYIFTGKIESDKTTNDKAYIYCETDSGQGHVYYGTYNVCVTGNGTAAVGLSSCKVFERYSGAKWEDVIWCEVETKLIKSWSSSVNTWLLLNSIIIIVEDEVFEVEESFLVFLFDSHSKKIWRKCFLVFLFESHSQISSDSKLSTHLKRRNTQTHIRMNERKKIQWEGEWSWIWALAKRFIRLSFA